MDQQSAQKKFWEWVERVSWITAIGGFLYLIIPSNKITQNFWMTVLTIAVILVSVLFIIYYRLRGRYSSSLPEVKPLSATSALRGLLPFEEGDNLFGRTQDIQFLTALLKSKECRFAVLNGDSGCGKTSILRAGVLPQLRKTNYIFLYIPSPTKEPRDAIKKAIRSELGDLWRDSMDALELLETLARKENKKIIVIFDQFEEFFILNMAAATRKPFAKWLSKIIKERDINISFLLAIRRDFFGDLHDFYPEIPEPTPAKFCYRLHNFDKTLSKEVLSLSAQVDGHSLSDHMINDVIDGLDVDGFIRPAELQIVGSQLVAKRMSDEDFEKVGRSEGVLRTYVVDTVKDSPHERASNIILRSLCAENGITKNPQDLTFEQIREAVGNNTLLANDPKITPEFIKRVLDYLVQSRIIVKTRDNGYNLIHDYLASRIYEATKVDETATEQANRLLKKYIAIFHDDENYVLSPKAYEQISRYASPELKKTEIAVKLLKAGRRKYWLTQSKPIYIALILVMVVGVILFPYNNLAYLSLEEIKNDTSNSTVYPVFPIPTDNVVLRRGIPDWPFPGFGEVITETDYDTNDILINPNGTNYQDLFKYDKLGVTIRNNYFSDKYDPWADQILEGIRPKERLILSARLGQYKNAEKILYDDLNSLNSYNNYISFSETPSLLYPDLISPVVIERWQILASNQEDQVKQAYAIRNLYLLSKFRAEKYSFDDRYVISLYDIVQQSPNLINGPGEALDTLLLIAQNDPDKINGEIVTFLYEKASIPESNSYPTLNYLPKLLENVSESQREKISADFFEKYFSGQKMGNVDPKEYTKVLFNRQWLPKLKQKVSSTESGKAEDKDIELLKKFIDACNSTHPEAFDLDWKNFLYLEFSSFADKNQSVLITPSEQLVLDLLVASFEKNPELYSESERTLISDFSNLYFENLASTYQNLNNYSYSQRYLINQLAQFQQGDVLVDRWITKLATYRDNQPMYNLPYETVKERYWEKFYFETYIIKSIIESHPEFLNQKWADFLYSEIKRRAFSHYPSQAEMNTWDQQIIRLFFSTWLEKPDLFLKQRDGSISVDIFYSYLVMWSENTIGTFDTSYAFVFLIKAEPKVFSELQSYAIEKYKTRQQELLSNPDLKKDGQYFPSCDLEMQTALSALTFSGNEHLAEFSQDSIDFLVGEALGEKGICQQFAILSLGVLAQNRLDFLTPEVMEQLIAGAKKFPELQKEFSNLFVIILKKKAAFAVPYTNELSSIIYQKTDSAQSQSLDQFWQPDLAFIPPSEENLSNFLDYLFNSKITIYEDGLGEPNKHQPINVYLEKSPDEIKSKMLSECVRKLTAPRALQRNNGVRICFMLAIDNAELSQELNFELDKLAKQQNPVTRLTVAKLREMFALADLEIKVRNDITKYDTTQLWLDYVATNSDTPVNEAAKYIAYKLKNWYQKELQNERTH